MISKPLARNYNMSVSGNKQHKIVDMRSDTVTRPSQAMKDAMMKCAVGDDVYGDDPTITYMQESMADFFGKEAALYVPSGTQSNLIAMLTSCKRKGDSAILGDKCHIYMYERGSLASIGNVMPQVLPTLGDGTFDMNALAKAFPPPTEHIAQPAVISLENSHGGVMGAPVPLDFVKQVKKLAKKHKVRMHLDGARILNALVEQKISPKEYVEDFDTVSFCLSKGMGCPLGSVLMGTKKDIAFANNMRKMVGGGMRQAGLTAACALVALEDWEEVLSLDNSNARYLANELNSNVDGISVNMDTVHTNMFAFVIDEQLTKKRKGKKSIDHFGLAKDLAEKHNVHFLPSFYNDAIRVVTHRDVNTEDCARAKKAIEEELKQYM